VLTRCPRHATAHAAVRAARDLRAEDGFMGAEVEAVTVTGTECMVERHNILEPADLNARAVHSVLRSAGALPRGARPRFL